MRSLPKYQFVHKMLYDALKSQAPAAPPAKRAKRFETLKKAATAAAANEQGLNEGDQSFSAVGLDDKVQEVVTKKHM